MSKLKKPPNLSHHPGATAGGKAALTVKNGHCERCNYPFAIFSSVHDSSTPCPLCKNAVPLTKP